MRSESHIKICYTVDLYVSFGKVLKKKTFGVGCGDEQKLMGGKQKRKFDGELWKWSFGATNTEKTHNNARNKEHE